MTTKENIAAAFAHVYTEADRLIQDVAKEHAIANMGQTLEEHLQRAAPPADVIAVCWSSFYGQSESVEMARDLDQERKGWLKQAKKDVATLVKKKLPLTLENARLAFERKLLWHRSDNESFSLSSMPGSLLPTSQRFSQTPLSEKILVTSTPIQWVPLSRSSLSSARDSSVPHPSANATSR